MKVQGMGWVIFSLIVLDTIINILDRGTLNYKWQDGIDKTMGMVLQQAITSDLHIVNGEMTPKERQQKSKEGLSYLKNSLGEITLKEFIDSDLNIFLGNTKGEKFGTTGVLIKMLDSKEGLTIQVHPDKEYASKMFNSELGKTESWNKLDGREINGEKSFKYLGLKEGATPEILGDLFKKQDINGMLDCLHRFEVQPGDAFIIYGGVPHAIGSGCFLMEVQEPTDYTMRVEKITPGGLAISDDLIHQGVWEENMMKCFHFDSCSFEEAMKRWKITPQIMQSSNSFTLKTIFNRKHSDCFGLNELDLNGEFILKDNGTFYEGVIYYGGSTITCGGEEYDFFQGDERFFSASVRTITWRYIKPSKILLCYPPV